MDILSFIPDIFKNTPIGWGLAVIGGGSLTFSVYFLADKVFDTILKRLDVDWFFLRLRNKAEIFANGMVKAISFFDDQLIDPVKRKLPETGIRLEDLIVEHINDIQDIFNDAFHRAKKAVRDVEE
ncbi:MAG: hypothetical protein HRT90_06170 [Candidatus Margulisbacteria bacterium]|nr:hypothetical protein [Candidatus Margulisiibacteriota bacterium]